MGRRIERVAHRIKMDLATAIGTLKHPEIGFVTVTKVEPSADLHYAKIFVSIMPIRGHEDPEKTISALKHSAGYLQSVIGKGLKMKNVPELRFIHDTSAEKAAQVSQLIREARDTDIDAPEHEDEFSDSSEEVEENDDGTEDDID